MLRLLFLPLSCFSSVSLATSVLKDKVALVTGASSGIGKVVSQALAKEGMKVVLVARRLDKLATTVEALKAGGAEASAFQCDVSSSESVQAAFKFSKDMYGGVDFVFANAGIEGGLAGTPLGTQDDADIAKVFNINVLGQTLTLKYAVEVFNERGGGTITFSSSIAALLGRTFYQNIARAVPEVFDQMRGSMIPYFASKAAVDMIAEQAHASYGDQNISVYNFNLAAFASEMGDRLGLKEDVPSGPIFKKLGNPIHVARALIAILDGSSQWQPGSHIVLENDCAIESKYFYDTLRDPRDPANNGWRSVGELRKFAKGVTGEPYEFKDEL